MRYSPSPLVFAAGLLLSALAAAGMLRLLPPVLYPVSVVLLAALGVAGLLRGRLDDLLYSASLAVLLVSVSWMLSSRLAILPRDDVYHYYPYMMYIRGTGRLAPPTEAAWFEKIFLGTVVPWPLWPVLVASLSVVTGAPLPYMVQAVQVLTTVPLTIAASAAVAGVLGGEGRRGRGVYLLVFLIPLLSFYVFTNTNPVSRAMPAALYLAAVYLMARIASGGSLPDYAALLILCLGMVFSHPYWSLAAPLLVAGYAASLYILRVLTRSPRGVVTRATVRRLMGVSAATASVAYAWLLYSTHTARASLVEMLEKAMDNGLGDILGLGLLRPWARMAQIQHGFFTVPATEHMVYWVVWLADLSPVVLALPAAAGVLAALLGRRRLGAGLLAASSLAASGVVVAAATGIASSGLVTRYAILLVYTPVCMAAALAVSRGGGGLGRAWLALGTVAAVVMAASAALSLGTRSYQAAFTWGGVGFMERGMHTPYASGPAEYCRSYCSYRLFDSLYSDDQAYRVYMGLEAFMQLAERMNTMPPESVLKLPGGLHGTVLVAVTRGLTPTYWMLKDKTWYGVDIGERLDTVKKMLRGAERVYDDGHAQLYILHGGMG